MRIPHVRVRPELLVVLLTIIIACGSPSSSSPSKSRASTGGDAPEPPDIFHQLGLPVPPIPIQWVESPESGTRHYYEKTLAYTGDRHDIAVQGFLTIDQDTPGSPRRYQLTEFHVQIGQPPLLVDTTKAAGDVSVERAVLGGVPVSVYRLNGTTAASYARTLVERNGTLSSATVGPSGEVLELSLVDFDRVATGTAQRIEATDLADAMRGRKIRLRVGQELVLRLEQQPGNPWQLAASSLGGALAPGAEHEEAGTEGGKPAKVFLLKAVKAGWTDLSFERPGGLATFRVKVD